MQMYGEEKVASGIRLALVSQSDSNAELIVLDRLHALKHEALRDCCCCGVECGARIVQSCSG